MDGPGSPSDDGHASEPLHGVGGSVLAVCAVVAVVGVLLAAFGKPAPSNAPAPGTTPSAGTPGVTATAGPKPTAPPSANPTGSPPTTLIGPSTPAQTPSTTTAAPPPPPADTERPVAKGHVVVFNETVHRGLAARFAAKLESEGWTVDGIGTWRGNVPATTVYPPPGLEPMARRLMAEHPEVGRTRPAFAGISRTAITVILAKDFPVSSVDGFGAADAAD